MLQPIQILSPLLITMLARIPLIGLDKHCNLLILPHPSLVLRHKLSTSSACGLLIDGCTTSQNLIVKKAEVCSPFQQADLDRNNQADKADDNPKYPFEIVEG